MFAENLKKYRKLSGLRQDDVAKVIGLDRSAYAYYESGKTQPSLENLVKISKMFGVDVSTLIGIETAAPVLDVCNEQQGTYNAGEGNGEENIGKCTADERLLLAWYRAVDNKKAVIDAVRAVYESELSEQ